MGHPSTTGREEVDRYLTDLGRMLDGADPAVRADVLGGVREHVDAALEELGRPATARDTRRVLADLGAPEAVAEEALVGARPALETPAASTAKSSVLSTAGEGASLVVALLALAVVGLQAGVLVDLGVAAVVLLGPLAVYLLVAFLLVRSPRWRGWQVAIALVLPLLLPVATWLELWSTMGVRAGPAFLSYRAVALVLVLTGLWLVHRWGTRPPKADRPALSSGSW